MQCHAVNKQRYYVALLPCKQFHLGGHGGHSSHRGAWLPWPPLRAASEPTTSTRTTRQMIANHVYEILAIFSLSHTHRLSPIIDKAQQKLLASHSQIICCV